MRALWLRRGRMLLASRPLVVLMLLMVLVVLSQLDLSIEVVSKMDEGGGGVDMKKKWEAMRREAVQQRIILSQESKIHRLSKIVSSLQRQLLECRSNSSNRNPDSARFV